MKFTVGGRQLDLDPDKVRRTMKGATAETIYEHVVEIDGKVFPPKQVFAAVTSWSRQSYTTLEAQRVLSRLGFVCRRASDPPSPPTPPRTAVASGDGNSDRIEALEAALSTAQAAIAGLHARVGALEATR